VNPIAERRLDLLGRDHVLVRRAVQQHADALNQLGDQGYKATLMDFDQSTDPKGVLTGMTANGKYFHGEDNKVLYYRVGHGDNGEPPM